MIQTWTPAGAPPPRGLKREIIIQSRRNRYSGDSLRSVPLERTLSKIEKFFLSGRLEAQFEMVRRTPGHTIRAVLEDLSSPGKPEETRCFGKGENEGQALVSACMEFVERLSAKMQPGDILYEKSYAEIPSQARDPRLFCLSPEADFDPCRVIDWVWGYSLSRSTPVLVPANLVFLTYETDNKNKIISWSDSNGLASGNNLEEAILHGLLEIVERDAVIISEFNRLPIRKIMPDILHPEVSRVIQHLEDEGFFCSIASVPSDHPIPVISVFLRHRDNPANCSVAFGCHLDAFLAISRALTEAIQLLPPSVNHEGWLNSDSPDRYAAADTATKPLSILKDLASTDLKKNIETCVDILRQVGSEVIAVDLSLPDIPFPAVRVLATRLQPVLRKGDMRLSPRFFEVPAKLGIDVWPFHPTDVRIWPLCGYR